MEERLTPTRCRAMAVHGRDPALVDACTVALLGTGPDVKHLRDRIGATIHGGWPRRSAPRRPDGVRVLETDLLGRHVVAPAWGTCQSGDVPGFWPTRPALMVGRAPGGQNR